MLCIFCKSKDVVKNGKRKRKVRTKQSYLCLSCKKQFVDVDGFERMRHKPHIIVRAIHMHEDGMSLSKVQNHLWQHDGVRVTRQTINAWTSKYAVFLKSAARRTAPNDKRAGTYRRESNSYKEKEMLRPQRD